jgi:membrane-associated phospholipid phosphatase
MESTADETKATARSSLAWRCARGFALVVLAAIASGLSSRYIAHAFPERPTPRDLLFEKLPYLDAGQYINDIVVFAAIFLLLGYGLTRGLDQLPDILGVFSTMYLLRAAMTVLTPLASAHGNGAEYGIVPVLHIPLVQNGMFPSGHAAAALLCFLMVDKTRAPRLRALQLALAVIAWITLLLSHGHYSIDIIGGLLLSYFVWREWTIGSLLRPVKRLIGT